MSAVETGEVDLTRRAGAIFEHFDLDGDGSITEEEFMIGEEKSLELNTCELRVGTRPIGP